MQTTMTRQVYAWPTVQISNVCGDAVVADKYIEKKEKKKKKDTIRHRLKTTQALANTTALRLTHAHRRLHPSHTFAASAGG